MSAKRLVYGINTLTVLYLIFVLWFVANSSLAIYKELAEVNQNIKREQNELLDKYRKVIVSILKNDLPQTSSYFNLLSSTAYNLPLVKELIIGELNSVAITTTRSEIPDSNNVLGCYDHKCIRIFAAKKDLADKFLQGKFKTSEVITAPVGKIRLFQITFNTFWEAHKNLLMMTFLYLSILYSVQAVYLFRKNFKLNKTYDALRMTADNYNHELMKYTAGFNKLGEGVLFMQELSSEYFVRHIHQLITRDICVTEIDLLDILGRVEKFLSYLITKRELNIILEGELAAKMKSDGELVFVILLNSVFRAVFRAKKSSAITIRIKQQQNGVIVEVIDTGYEYRSDLGDKIMLHELPEPIMDNLYKKTGVNVEEQVKDGVNIIVVRFTTPVVTEKSVDNIIKLNLYGKKH